MIYWFLAWLLAVCKITIILLNRALSEGTAIRSRVWNHSGRYWVRSLDIVNECTKTQNSLLTRRCSPQLNHPFKPLVQREYSVISYRYKFLFNWLLNSLISFHDRVLFITGVASNFLMIIKKQAQIMQKRLSFQETQYLNSLCHFHSLLQLDCISRLNEGAGEKFKHQLPCWATWQSEKHETLSEWGTLSFFISHLNSAINIAGYTEHRWRTSILHE